MTRKTVAKIFALAATTTAIVFFGSSAALAGDTDQTAGTPAPAATVVVTPTPSPSANNPWD